MSDLLSRLIVSYMAVWLIIYVLFTALDWRMAFQKLHSQYGLISVAVLCLLGLGLSVDKGVLF